MTTEGFGKRSLLYGAELIFEENYLGGAGSGRAHRTRASPSARSHGPSWSRPDQVTKLEVSSGFGLVTSFDVAARDGRFKRTSITSPKPGTPTVSALTRARAGRKPATRPARPGDGQMAFRSVCASKNDTGQAGCRAPRGAGPGDTVTSAANPQISNYNPPTPSALQFRDLRAANPQISCRYVSNYNPAPQGASLKTRQNNPQISNFNPGPKAPKVNTLRISKSRRLT